MKPHFRFFPLLVCSVCLWQAHAQTPGKVTLVTIPESIPAVRPDGSISNPDRPGFRVEVLRAAGKSCGLTVQFLPVPWQRAVEMVKTGVVDGAFSASWSEERAVFGAFPMRNGALDPSKAMKGYTYSLFVPTVSAVQWDGKTLSGGEKKAIVERGSAGTGIATRLGLEPVEASSYLNMVRMLVEKRAGAMVGVGAHVDKVLEENPAFRGQIRELPTPLEAKHGYVMFSKSYYQAHAGQVDCFWKALGDIRARPSYRDLVKSYNNGEFEE